MHSCASIVLVFLGSVCSAVVIDGSRPLSSFDKLLLIAVQTASWWIAVDGRLVAGVVEWLFGKVLLDVRLKPAN